jgi:hypothetical protein
VDELTRRTSHGFEMAQPRQLLLQRVLDLIKAGRRRDALPLLEAFIDDAPLQYAFMWRIIYQSDTAFSELISRTIAGDRGVMGDEGPAHSNDVLLALCCSSALKTIPSDYVTLK